MDKGRFRRLLPGLGVAFFIPQHPPGRPGGQVRQDMDAEKHVPLLPGVHRPAQDAQPAHILQAQVQLPGDGSAKAVVRIVQGHP